MNKFSIIIPVRNGGKYLKQAVQSVLVQGYIHFNLLIIESGSSDDSIEYIQSINDERVVLHTTSQILGIEDNWARILKIEKNEFMTILGQDDVLLPDYLAVINDLVNEYPHASLYQTHFNQINAKGKFIKQCQRMDEIEPTHFFLTSILENKIDFMASGFMMRSKDYDSIGGIANYPNLLFADMELFLKISQKGFLAVSPKICFLFRVHQSTTAISADIKFQLAFKQFIIYLEELSKINKLFKTVIAEHGNVFIQFYCKGLAHRLIRTPKKLRHKVTVAKLIDDCKQYGKQLKLEKDFDPQKTKSIRIAKWIDDFALTRYAFLIYKKLYRKPML